MKRRELLNVLDQQGLRLSKTKSQHLLIDDNILELQMRYANIRKKDIVLEIGTGLGFLTQELAKRAEKVITIEKDRQFIEYLEKNLPENVELIIADILDIDLPRFDKVVANIPYKISSKLIFKLLDKSFTAAILLFQFEFALRMVAGVEMPDYSRLAVKINSKAHCEILHKVSRNSFFPVPKVDSAIVELVPREPDFPIINEELFDKVVDAVFNQKRKMIKNALLNKYQWFCSSQEDFKVIQKELDWQTKRGEELSPAQLAELSNNIHLALLKFKEK
jgi:16S rRNA (adenine1518-N6/adenine1519-N6)-dimethyltransferase